MEPKPHFAIDSHACNCGKSYKNRDHLRRHLKAKTNPIPGQPGSPEYQVKVNALMNAVIEMLTRPQPDPPLITVNIQAVYIYANRLDDSIFNAKAKAS